MPAIQLARLKIQITELLTFFDMPDDFIRELHIIFGFYADRTRRHGQSGKPKPLIQTYTVPRQVMRRIYSDITKQVVDDPKSALVLADQLWEDNWFECRLLAINILGLMSLKPPTHVISRLRNWGEFCREDALVDALLNDGAKKLREEMPHEFQILVEEWLSVSTIYSLKLGLRAIPALVMNPAFENLPVFYRLLSPFVRESTSVLEVDLLMAVRALGQRSPQETAYFLKQNLIAPHKSGTAVIVRRSLDVFPANLQESLREILREQMQEG
jgi:hypothetical protein